MISFIEHWTGYLWMIFGVSWLLAAFTSKRSVQLQSGGSRMLQSGLYLLALVMVFNVGNWFTGGWPALRIVSPTRATVMAGAVATCGGLLFACWARLVLGRNWSGTVTIKQDHTLIRRGPYRLVRHPIYTGLLLALLGTALTYGYARCFAGVLVAALAFWIKSQTEEQFMVQQFGEQYVEYRRRVRALIPFVL